MPRRKGHGLHRETIVHDSGMVVAELWQHEGASKIDRFTWIADAVWVVKPCP